MKCVQGIWSGSYEYLKTMKVRDEKKLRSIPNKKYLQSALNKLEMGDSKGSVSPKLDKACIDGDSEELDGGQTSATKERTFKARYGCCVTKFEKSDNVGDETLEAATEIRQGHRGSCQPCVRCVTTTTGENSWSRDWKSTQTLTWQVNKRNGRARAVR